MDETMVALSKLRMMEETEKDLTPTRVVLRDRESLILEAAQARRLFKGSSVSRAKQPEATYIGVKHYSKEPIHNLSCVRFREMFTPMVHIGKYVLCRTISLPVAARVLTIDVLVEDPSGDALPLAIFNFPLPLFSKAQDDIFPIGTLLAIREPYMKPFLLESSRPFIQVDSPTDIIFLDSQSNLLQDVIWKFPSLGPTRPPNITALECKLDGNQKFKGKRWLSAALAYTKGLSLSPSHDLYITLRLNRAEAYLKLGYLSAALADAQLVLSDKALPQHSLMLGKALLKAGKVNYFQDKYQEALTVFMKLKNIPDGIAEAETWISRTHLRIAEQNHGDYDWYKIFIDSEVVGSKVDVADYLGPIEVKDLRSCGHGRGVIASRDISPGELLLVCKPLVSVFHDELENSRLFGLTPPHEGISTTSQVALMHKCMQNLYGNPSMKNLVYGLYASAPYPPSPGYLPEMGSEILHEPLRTSIDIDVSRVENICLRNMFSPVSVGYAESNTDSKGGPAALYIFSSIFNHSCCQNTHLTFLQDVMVVRARSKILKGEEVFFTYTGLDTYAKRCEVLKKWAFTCQCQLCQDDRTEGSDALATRERLEIGVDEAFSLKSDVINQIRANIMELEERIKQVKNTYAASRRSPKMTLAHMHDRLAWQLQHLAEATNDSKHYYRAIGELFQSLKALGIPITDDSMKGKVPRKCRREPPIDKENFNVVEHDRAISVGILFGLIPCFVALGDKIRGERWLRAAWLIHDIIIGGGRKLFEERYKLFYQQSFIQQLPITSRPDEE